MRYDSPERFYTAATWAVLGAAAYWAAFRYLTQPAAVALFAAAGTCCVAVAALATRRYVTIEPETVVDVSGLRVVRLRRRSIVGISVARAPRRIGGWCVHVDLDDGTGVALRGTRVHARVPSRAHLAHLPEVARRITTE